MKYLIILGRNIELSLAELKQVLGEFKYKINKNAILADFEEFDEEIIKKLGGTIAIGKVICKISELENKGIYEGTKNNFSYCIWDFSDKKNFVSEILKNKFRGEKLKASEKKIHEEMDLQKGGKVNVLNSKRLIDEQYFIFEEFFGKIIKTSDYREIEERDMKKPNRRESLSISPRLSKIMINLSGVRENEILVDPFCGIGVILSEALNQNIKVIGIDNDKEAINACKENLEWFGFNKNDYKLICNDSSKVKIEKADCLVAEPDLGRILKKVPPKNKANETLKNFENLVINVINNLKDSVKGKIVITCPKIKTIKERLSCNFEKIAQKTSYKIMEGFPIEEFRKNQIVGRDIVVLVKE